MEAMMAKRLAERFPVFVPCPKCGLLNKETPVAEVREKLTFSGEMQCPYCGAVVFLGQHRQIIEEHYNICEAIDKEDRA